MWAKARVEVAPSSRHRLLQIQFGRLRIGTGIRPSHSTAMSLPYALEKQVAVAAVLRACSLTSSVFENYAKVEKLTKDDKSPVTGRWCSDSSSEHCRT